MAKITITIEDNAKGNCRVKTESRERLPAKMSDYTPAQKLAAGVLVVLAQSSVRMDPPNRVAMMPGG